MERVSLGRKFVIFALTLTIINGGYFFIGKYFIDERDDFLQKTQVVINKTIPALNLSQQLIFNLTEVRRLHLNAIVSKEIGYGLEYLKKEEALISENESILAQYAVLSESPEETAILASLKESWKDYLSKSRTAISLLKSGEKEKARDIILYESLVYLITFEHYNQELMEMNNSYITSFSLGTISNQSLTMKLFNVIMALNILFQSIIFTVISKQYRTNTKAIDDANIDPLTNLFNRRKVLSEWRGKNNKVLILGDIDHFKRVNDTYGHHIGDFILIEIAKVLQQGSSSTDLVARIGGEEFVIITSKNTLEEAYDMAEKIRKTVEHTSFTHHSGVTIDITISFGLGVCVHNDSPFEETLSLADQKLYQAKKEGRNKTLY